MVIFFEEGDDQRLGTVMCTTSFHPSFGERSKILNSVRASNLAWLPLTVHSNVVNGCGYT